MFDPAKFSPGYIPKTVMKGAEEYMIVVSGVKDTGLCGGYWGNNDNLGSRKHNKLPEALEIELEEKTRRRGGIAVEDTTLSSKTNTKNLSKRIGNLIEKGNKTN